MKALGDNVLNRSPKSPPYLVQDFARSDYPQGLDFPAHSYMAFIAGVFRGIRKWTWKALVRKQGRGQKSIAGFANVEIDYVLEKRGKIWKAWVVAIRNFPWASTSGGNTINRMRRAFWVQTGWKLQGTIPALREAETWRM